MASVIPGGTAREVRCGDAAVLERALTAGRTQVLMLFDGFERALGHDGLHIDYDPLLNLPLWELGHLAWFEEFWLARNPQRDRGAACDPSRPRAASPLLGGADALYDSSNVAHAARWQAALPDADTTRSYLAAVRQRTLALLRDCAPDDDTLYFFRWVLFHEDMHREAWHMMAQRLGIDLGPSMTRHTPRAPSVASSAGEWRVGAAALQLGCAGPGFAFDNELAPHTQSVAAFAIDRAPVTWARFLPFLEAGGASRQPPLHLRQVGGDWQQQRFGAWVPLDMAAPAMHLTAFEAEAWCRWAGRRLPTEAEWELAATLAPTLGEVFDWGEVWEWTASPFAPYPGFVPHPYRDYSAPWFDGRPVLRGASFATAPHMKHPRYRNFFEAQRSDVFAGFRSCAAG